MIPTIEVSWRFGTIELPVADRYIRPALELTGEYSGAEIDLYRHLVRPGDVALDIGANIGVFAVAMGLAVGPSGRVLAFEPQPTIFRILQRNLARHGLGQVDARREIVAERSGEGRFPDIRTLPDGMLVNFGGIARDSRIGPQFGTVVPTAATSVDSLGLARCDFVKIDVEGGEMAVIEGASETIAHYRPVLSIECDRPNAPAPWVDGLLAAGYRIWRFRGSNLRTPNPNSAAIDGQPNFTIIMALAVPDERVADLPPLAMPAFQPVASRSELELLSRWISVDARKR